MTVQAITFDGEAVLPTAVGYNGARWLVGRDAKALMWRAGARVFVDFLRFGEQATEISGERFSPSQLAAIVVREVRRHAEVQLGGGIHKCILSTPAYLTMQEQQVLREAVSGELELLAAISEPVCGIFGAGISETAHGALIVRMGGRSLDVAIACRRSPWEVLAIDGNLRLGGVDLDRVLVDWYMMHLPSKEQDNLLADPSARRRLLEEAERAKCVLSTHDRAVLGPIPIDDFNATGPQEVTRAEFNHLANSIAQACGEVVERAVEQAKERGLSREEIDSFVFYGGSASVPILRRTLEERAGHSVSVPPSAATLSARGAAVIGARRFQADIDKPVEEASLLTCIMAPEPISIKLAESQHLTVIERGTLLPVSVQHEFRLLELTDEVRIPMYEGETSLGDFVAPVPASIEPGTSVLLEFQLDADQQLACRISLP